PNIAARLRGWQESRVQLTTIRHRVEPDRSKFFAGYGSRFSESRTINSTERECVVSLNSITLGASFHKRRRGERKRWNTPTFSLGNLRQTIPQKPRQINLTSSTRKKLRRFSSICCVSKWKHLNAPTKAPRLTLRARKLKHSGLSRDASKL